MGHDPQKPTPLELAEQQADSERRAALDRLRRRGDEIAARTTDALRDQLPEGCSFQFVLEDPA